MLGQSYFQLMSPLIFLVFSLGFILLWHHARDIQALRFLAVSYFLGSCALFGDFLRGSMHPDVASALMSLLYLSSGVALCAALYAFYRGRVAWRTLGASAAAVYLVFSWLRFGLEDMALCTWAINGGIVAIVTHTQYRLRREMRQRRIDRALQVVIGLASAMLVLRTGAVLWFEGATASDPDYAGSLEALTLQLCVGISALAVAGVLFVMFGMEIVRRLTETSETDPLTGVLNRRGFEAKIGAVAADATGGTASHAVIMADIDRFKSVNDTFGHEVGDQVIKAFARLLENAVNESGFVVRWGGEEFLVVLVNADERTARLCCEGVRAAWEALPHDCLEGGSVTASFGIAIWPGGQNLSEAAHLADMALYRAKREGRNRVRAYAPAAAGRREVAVA